jgi:hypothetical protein
MALVYNRCSMHFVRPRLEKSRSAKMHFEIARGNKPLLVPSTFELELREKACTYLHNSQSSLTLKKVPKIKLKVTETKIKVPKIQVQVNSSYYFSKSS